MDEKPKLLEPLQDDTLAGHKRKFNKFCRDNNWKPKKSNKRDRKDKIKQFETKLAKDDPTLDYYNKGNKRMRIEQMFSELSLNGHQSPTSKSSQREYSYEDSYQGSECFSIEIQKIQSTKDLNEGDILPRRKRKRAKTYVSQSNSPSFGNHTNVSESDSLRKSPVRSEFVNFSENTPNPKPEDLQVQSDSNREKSDDTKVSIEIDDNKEDSQDKEMDTTNEIKPRSIRITILNDLDKVIFEKSLTIDHDSIKIKPFLDIIDELCAKSRGLSKYKKFFKKALYKKFNIPDFDDIFQDNF